MSVKTLLFAREEVAGWFRRFLALEGCQPKLEREIRILSDVLSSETSLEPDNWKTRRWILYCCLNKSAFRGHTPARELAPLKANGGGQWAATSRPLHRDHDRKTVLRIRSEVIKTLKLWSANWDATERGRAIYSWTHHIHDQDRRERRAGIGYRTSLTYNVNDFIEPRVMYHPSQSANSEQADAKILARFKEQVPVGRCTTWLFCGPTALVPRSEWSKQQILRDLERTSGSTSYQPLLSAHRVHDMIQEWSDT